MVPIFGVLLLGLGLRRIRLLTRAADETLLRLTLNVLIPCLIWDSIVGNPALDQPGNAWWPPLVGFTTVAVGVLLALVAARAAGLKLPAEVRSFALSTGLYNWAYMALPLCVALFDKETVGVLFVHNLGVEVCLWTVGIMVLSGGRLRDSWRKLFNGPVLAILSGLMLHKLDAEQWIPAPVWSGVSMLGASAIPLGLLLVGATFWDHLGAADVLRHPRVGVTACLIRLGLLPIGFIVAAALLPVSHELRAVMLVQAAMPSAMFPVILAGRYGADVPTAVRVVVWTTVAGFFTMLLWIPWGMNYLGLAAK
ncbi:MAG: AEC family transporter [Candidatus Methylacidiphilales bacterium]